MGLLQLTQITIAYFTIAYRMPKANREMTVSLATDCLIAARSGPSLNNDVFSPLAYLSDCRSKSRLRQYS